MKIGDLVINKARPGRGPGLIVASSAGLGLDRFEDPRNFCVLHTESKQEKWYNLNQLKVISES